MAMSAAAWEVGSPRVAERQRLEHAIQAARARLEGTPDSTRCTGVLQMKVKGGMFGDSWPDADCSFVNSSSAGGTFTFRTTDGSKSGTRRQCRFDVTAGSGARRFNISGAGGETVELRAANDAEHMRWMAQQEVASAELALTQAKARWEKEDREEAWARMINRAAGGGGSE